MLLRIIDFYLLESSRKLTPSAKSASFDTPSYSTISIYGKVIPKTLV